MQLSTDQQPTPEGKGPPIFDLMMEDIEERKAAGIKTYGEPLKAFNGRDPLVDAYQEVLDLAVYLRQELYERYGV
jgi:hypothetical protein